jgi:hypothetical protein
MCEELIPRTKHRCGHVVDQNGTLKEYENCGNCGTVKHTSYLGQTTKNDLCPDCVYAGRWVRDEQGAWKKA